MDGLSDYWIRVRGGIPNQAADVKIVNGSLIVQANAFDAVGDLMLSVRGLDPFEYAPTITVTSDRCFDLVITPAVKPTE